MSNEQRERAKRRLWSAYMHGFLTLDDVETMCRILGRPTRLPMFGRPAWTRW